MTNIYFADWLREELKKRDWSQADLSKKAGISPSQVTRVLSGERGIGEESLNAIARALNISPITVFRKAGLLPEEGRQEVSFEDWMYLISQLDPQDEEELRKIAEMKIERKKKGQEIKILKTRKAG
jgi:transcriptional regulator with XRE-family HTH domain